jgi:hypothetical protein
MVNLPVLLSLFWHKLVEEHPVFGFGYAAPVSKGGGHAFVIVQGV